MAGNFSFPVIGGLVRYFLGGNTTSFNSSHRLNGPTIKLAAKFYATSTSPITSVRPYVVKTGTVTGMTFTVAIWDSASDVPNAVLGAASSAWTGPAASGFLADQTLGSNTGSLTINAPYWMVWECASGTPDASNYLEISLISLASSISLLLNLHELRVYNGTNWTTVSAFTTSPTPNVLFTHQDGTFSGIGAGAAATVGTDVFGTNRQGLRFQVGAPATIYGVYWGGTKAGSPNAVELLCFEGSTQKGSTGTFGAAEWNSFQSGNIFMLGAPASVAKDTNIYLVMRQASDGGSDAADYDTNGCALPSGQTAAMMPSNWRYVYGTGNDPTSYSVDDGTFIPRILPIIGPDIQTGITGGGGLITHPGMTGRMGA